LGAVLEITVEDNEKEMRRKELCGAKNTSHVS
jgi:hypothetical protein